MSARCKECGQPAKWLAPRTSVSTTDRGGLWAFLCERHYSVLLIKRGRLLDPKYDEFVVVLDREAVA